MSSDILCWVLPKDTRYWRKDLCRPPPNNAVKPLLSPNTTYDYYFGCDDCDETCCAGQLNTGCCGD